MKSTAEILNLWYWLFSIFYIFCFYAQDEWMTCQRNWLYLESIFSAPDIQRQLPAEAKMFMQVDKSWKDIMRKVYRLPNAFRASTQPGLLETFQQNNALLDQIQKCLEAYLESKCVVFPRYFCSKNLLKLKNWIIKVGLLPSKNVGFICFNESPLKIMKIYFYFTLKAPFVLKVINFWPDFFGHAGKRFDKKLRLISKFMTL